MLRKKLGNLGEQEALRYLTKIGYRFIDKNFSCSFGEIDLIFKDKKCLVFVEVKTRIGTSRGSPEEAITTRKVNTIKRTSEYFMKLSQISEVLQRIDAVAIVMDQQGNVLDLRHIKNVTG